MTTPDASTKPNILWIIVDQLTAALTGAYGHPVVQTPHLDRLVEEGVRFDAAYANCPVCLPSRGAMLSGQFISNCKTYDNGSAWPDDMVTIPHYLTLAGYDTALIGKMHMVGADQLHGFDRRHVSNIYPADFKWSPARQDPLTMGEEDELEYRPTGNQAPQYIGEAIHPGRWSNTLSYDEETHFRALEFLRAWAEQKRTDGTVRGPKGVTEMPPPVAGLSAEDEPFMLCVSYHHPHEPFWPPQEYWDLYEDEPIDLPQRPDNLEETYSVQDKWLNDYHGCDNVDLFDVESAYRVRRAYYGLVTYIDDKIGDLMATLEETGLADNTIVIFCSDHGDMLCEKGMVQKRSFYEWSCRVPLIVRMPDGAGTGRAVAAPVTLVDLMPTMLDWAGVKERLPMDGESLMPLIAGEEQPDRIAFAEIHSEGIHGNCFMVRKGRFKYMYIHKRDEQLFDLVADPDEWHNLADDPAHAEVKIELRAAILDRFDPDAIECEVTSGLLRRRLIRTAMQRTGTRWDAQIRLDGTRDAMAQYLP
jgi:choline-sulfatase